MNNTVQLYEEKLNEILELRGTLENEYNYNLRIYQSLKTDSAIPDVSILDFLKEFPNWTKVLTSELVIEIIQYFTTPSEEAKNNLTKKLLERNQVIIYKKRDLDFTLNDCPFEIDEKISKCDTKIEELERQAKAITKRIGIIEAEKLKWLELKKKI